MSLGKILEKHSKHDSKLTVHVNMFESPLGKIIVAADDNYVYMIGFEDSKNLEKMLHVVSEKISCGFIEEKNTLLQTVEKELLAYFEGNLKEFTIPIKTFGSDFQMQVWQKLQELPYGVNQTYGDLAKSLGKSVSHSRAVGAACGANNHLLVIPCHRMVAASSNGGFSSGINRKEWLLEHEKKFTT